MNNKSEVNVCFVMDSGYVMPTCVAVTSIFVNKNINTNYNIYILCNNVSQEDKDKFLELSRKDFAIYFVDLDNMEKYSDLGIETISATPTSISKFFVPDILKDLDKVIYLDGDIIVNKDLAELFSIELEDNYVAAVKDLCGIDHSNYKKEDFRYFNSGVMLMNLKEMRKNDLSKKMLEYRLNGYNDMMDQDTLNYILKEHVMILPLKYNMQINLLAQVDQQKSKVFNVEALEYYYELPNDCAIDDVLSDAVVVHYATYKPWKFYDLYGNMIWEKVFNSSPYKDLKLPRQGLLVNSTSYRVGKALLAPLVKLKQIKHSYLYRRRQKFLGQFVWRKDKWKYDKSDLPKCRNYRGEK